MSKRPKFLTKTLRAVFHGGLVEAEAEADFLTTVRFRNLVVEFVGKGILGSLDLSSTTAVSASASAPALIGEASAKSKGDFLSPVSRGLVRKEGFAVIETVDDDISESYHNFQIPNSISNFRKEGELGIYFYFSFR